MELIHEVDTLAISIKDGDLEYRANTARLKGDYSTILEGMNQAVDNMAEPFEMAIDFIARASKGQEVVEVTKRLQRNL